MAAAAGHPVRLFDIAPAAAQRAIDDLARRLRQRVNDGKADAAPTEALLARLECADSLEQLADCTLVIEAVAENLAIKQALFRDLEALCSPTALFASNTSSLSITAIAGALKHPARMAGLHFFNPAPLMKLVEIVSGTETGAETLAALQAWRSAGVSRASCADRRRDLSSTAWRGRSMPKPCARWRNGWLTPPRWTRSCATPAASPWARCN